MCSNERASFVNGQGVMTMLGSLGLAAARGAIALAIAAVIWSVAAAVVGSPMTLPDLPTAVARLAQLAVTFSFWSEAWLSLQRLILGYGAAMLVGIPLGLVLAEVQALRFIAGGLVNGLAGIPLLALAPFMAVWFGIGDGSKVALAFAVAVFPIMSDITSGLARGKSHATEASPNATRCVLATLRRALVLAVAAVLIGEMVAATHGLGYLMMTSVATFDTATLAAVTLVAALPCAFVVSLIRWIEETFA